MIDPLDNLARAILSFDERPKAISSGFSGWRGGGAKWPYGLAQSGASVQLNHAELRRNGRKAYHDTPQAKAIVDRFADTVADIGLQFESTPDADVLGIDSEKAEAWARNFESRLHLWSLSKKQNRSELMTFYQSHRLYHLIQQRENDVFIRLYYSTDKDLLNPLQFEFIDADQVRGDAITSTAWGESFEDGIERDERGREKTYRIWVKSKKGTFDSVDIPAKGSKSGRVFMLHGFNPEYAGQRRGYSRLAHVIQEFEKLTDFTAAQIQKAINQSNITLYTKPSQDADASNPLEAILTNAGAGPAAAQFGADPVPADSAQGITDDALMPIVSWEDLPEVTMRVPGSVGIFNLLKGEDIRAFENTSPSDSFNTFVDAFTGYLSASMGQPIEVTLMKFNENFSASRATLILFWRVCEMWRHEMAADYLNPVVEMWAAGEIAAGRIVAPGWSDPILRAAWLKGSWIGAPMPNIDPSKTAKATEIYAKLGLTTLDREARNLNGSSGQANRKKLVREYSELPLSPYEMTVDIPDDTEDEK